MEEKGFGNQWFFVWMGWHLKLWKGFNNSFEDKDGNVEL
jgi:hypothetical protein